MTLQEHYPMDADFYLQGWRYSLIFQMLFVGFKDNVKTQVDRSWIVTLSSCSLKPGRIHWKIRWITILKENERSWNRSVGQAFELCCYVLNQSSWSLVSLHLSGTSQSPEFPQSANRELKQWRRQRQREWQKQQLCTCITLFCTFHCCHYTTTMWNCPISRFVKDVNARRRISFTFLKLQYSPLEFNSRNICQNFLLLCVVENAWVCLPLLSGLVMA